jgi:transposase-like protein
MRPCLASSPANRHAASRVAGVGPGPQLVDAARLSSRLTNRLAGSPNSRNGGTLKTVHTNLGPVRIEVPRDRVGSFEPQIVPKNARRIGGFDEAIISLYAKGLTTGEIQAHLHDVYGAEISRELVSRVTDAVNDELVAWRNRPLDRGTVRTTV